jgi:CheY-like chemotaxis protein
VSTVLIIDDEVGFVRILEMILRRAGYHTCSATDGAEGLRLVEECTPDLIILDDMMPGLSGTEMCVRLRRDPLRQSVPIIIHTAGLKLRHPEQLKAIGADALLIKPTMPQVMIDTVGRLLQQASA